MYTFKVTLQLGGVIYVKAHDERDVWIDYDCVCVECVG